MKKKLKGADGTELIIKTSNGLDEIIFYFQSRARKSGRLDLSVSYDLLGNYHFILRNQPHVWCKLETLNIEDSKDFHPDLFATTYEGN